MRIVVGALILSWLGAAVSFGFSVNLDNLQFVPANDPINVFSVEIATDSIGNDSDTSTVTGAISAQLDFDLMGTTPVPTGLELLGGQAMFSDMNFSFLFGVISATTSGLAGVPDTPTPPSIVSGGMFPAMDHTFLLDQGTISAAGQEIDLSTMPLLATGTGSGQVSVLSAGAPVGNEYPFTATITLPSAFDEPFMLTNVPIVGNVNGSIAGGGTIQVRQDFTLTIIPGDYNLDGELGCDDLGELEQAISIGSTNLFFDANADGTVDQADELFWITDLRQAIPGDANLDDLVDGSDFVIWNANKFQSSTGWCTADWSHDDQTDGSDFVLWNANKFGQSDAILAVPEPGRCWYGMALWAGLVLRRRRAAD